MATTIYGQLAHRLEFCDFRFLFVHLELDFAASEMKKKRKKVLGNASKREFTIIPWDLDDAFQHHGDAKQRGYLRDLKATKAQL